jgi:serine/threonine protein kinase
MKKELIKIPTVSCDIVESNVIYDSMIGSSVITLNKTKDSRVYVHKRIYKDRLVSEEMLEDAIRECTIISQLDHPNIVSFYNYKISDEFIDINLEYLNKHDYLHRKISEVY